jgi:hypothetical protein
MLSNKSLKIRPLHLLIIRQCLNLHQLPQKRQQTIYLQIKRLANIGQENTLNLKYKKIYSLNFNNYIIFKYSMQGTYGKSYTTKLYRLYW